MLESELNNSNKEN